ncbi:hypothetical protein PR048_002146 [Dryococelus australis]|uniref:Uncharacterized protein n=1 Tax=Dryococelus australis TaxID=614101 RepID=A0ABQ9IJJ1_9NEOP|nr:hypothetical protein PR048_002146 [Dryococelus australis]
MEAHKKEKTVEEWKQKISIAHSEYQPRDMFYDDGIGLFLELYQQESWLGAKRSVLEETDDDDNQPLHKLADLLRRGCQYIDAEAVVSFNDNLSTERVERVVPLTQSNPSDEADQEDDDKNNGQEDESKQTVEDLNIKNHDEALCAVRDLEKYIALKNCPMFVDLMQDATGLSQKATIQKTVWEQTLMNMWQNTALT